MRRRVLRAALVGLFVAAGLGSLFACSGSSSRSPRSGRLSVFVSIPPQAQIVKRIGGSDVRVSVLLPPGQEPVTYEPSPRRIEALASADVYFTIGIPFEARLLPKIEGHGRPKVVDMAAGVVRRRMSGPSEPPSEFGTGIPKERPAARAGELADPHVWLSPSLIRVLAENTERTLSGVHPSGSDLFRRNLAGYRRDLDAVDRRIAHELAPYRGRTFFVFHPAFGYFADAYGLRQRSVEVEGKSPTPKELARFVAEAREAGATTIFAQPGFDERPAEAAARPLGGRVVLLDPLAPDLVANLEDVAKRVASAFREAGRAGKGADRGR